MILRFLSVGITFSSENFGNLKYYYYYYFYISGYAKNFLMKETSLQKQHVSPSKQMISQALSAENDEILNQIEWMLLQELSQLNR